MGVFVTDFYKQMNDAGVKTTEADIETEFLKIAEDKGIVLYNKDNYSPFWTLIKSLCVESTRWLMVFVAEHLLPNRYLKTAKDTWLDLIGWGYRLERGLPGFTQGYITFTRFSNSGGLSIKAGTIIQSLPASGVVYELEVLEDTDFIEGDITLKVLCQAKEEGANFNLGGGLYVVLPESITGIASVKNDDGWATQLGSDREDDEEFRLRIRDQWDALNSFHVDTVYKRLISEVSGIDKENIYFDKTTGRGPGSADALILLETGLVGDELLARINGYINDEGNHGHGDSVQAFNLPRVDIELNVDAYYSQVLTTEQRSALLQQVEIYIRAAFRELSGSEFTNKPTQTEPFKRFSLSRLASELHKEFEHLTDVDFNADSPIHTLNVSQINTLTITGYGEV